MLAGPEALGDSWVDVLRPGFHEFAAAFEEVGALVGKLNVGTCAVTQAQFSDRRNLHLPGVLRGLLRLLLDDGCSLVGYLGNAVVGGA